MTAPNKGMKRMISVPLADIACFDRSVKEMSIGFQFNCLQLRCRDALCSRNLGHVFARLQLRYNLWRREVQSRSYVILRNPVIVGVPEGKRLTLRWRS